MLRQRPSVRFFELIGGLTKMHIVVTFLALLELAKLHRIIVQQDERFDDIIIATRRDEEASDQDASHEQSTQDEAQ
jgi:segregation and condensation protein A